jgi:hypothetical protein
MTTTLTLDITQLSSSSVTGTISFSDTEDRSGSAAVSGGLQGDYIVLQSEDFDPACSGRTITWAGTVAGMSMDMQVSAPATDSCIEISEGNSASFERQ